MFASLANSRKVDLRPRSDGYLHDKIGLLLMICLSGFPANQAKCADYADWFLDSHNRLQNFW